MEVYRAVPGLVWVGEWCVGEWARGPFAAEVRNDYNVLLNHLREKMCFASHVSRQDA